MPISKPLVQKLGAEAAKALEEVAANYGLTVKAKGGSFDDLTATLRFEFASRDAASTGFARDASAIGLEPDDFGKTFTVRQGAFEITGINLRASRYPVLAKKIGTDKVYKFSEAAVKAALGRSTLLPALPITNI